MKILLFSDENIMRLIERQGFTGIFQKNGQPPHNYTKTEVGQMKYMSCILTCLKINNCHFFKHGNETKDSDINHFDVKHCVMWTVEL